MLGIFLGLNAQVHVAYTMPVGWGYAATGLSASATNYIAPFSAYDTITKYTDHSFVIYPNVNGSYEYYLAYKIDSVSGGVSVRDSVLLQGRYFDSQNWTTITGVKYFGHRTTGLTTSDSIIYFSGLLSTSGTISETVNYDTTKIFGNGANDLSILKYDTTKIVNHVGPTLKSLYYATITEKNRQLYSATVTGTNTCYLRTKYRELRFYVKHIGTGTQIIKVKGIEIKIIP